MSPQSQEFILCSHACPREKSVRIYSNDIKKLGDIMGCVQELIHSSIVIEKCPRRLFLNVKALGQS